MKKFGTIVADPNWKYDDYGQKGHGAAKEHYQESDVAEICKIPVGEWARPTTNLILFGTCPKPDLAVDVIRAWGFQIVTSIAWVKTTPTSADIAQGTGFWFFQPAEWVFFCRRSKKAKAPKYKSMKHKPMGLLVGGDGPMTASFYSPRGSHSRKPPSFIEWIEAYLPGPRLELYATGKKPGWTCWGHSTGYHLYDGGVMTLKKAQREGLVPPKTFKKEKP